MERYELIGNSCKIDGMKTCFDSVRETFENYRAYFMEGVDDL